MLWSTRTSSSRQVVGSETVWVNDGNPALMLFGIGISPSSACPTAVMGTAAGFGTLGQSAPGHRSEKLPPLSATDGTFWLTVSGFFSRLHSWDQKKNVFCFAGW